MAVVATVDSAAESAAIRASPVIAPVMGHDDEVIGPHAVHMIDIAAWGGTEQGHARPEPPHRANINAALPRKVRESH